MEVINNFVLVENGWGRRRRGSEISTAVVPLASFVLGGSRESGGSLKIVTVSKFRSPVEIGGLFSTEIGGSVKFRGSF